MSWMSFIHQVKNDPRSNKNLFAEFCRHYNKEFAQELCNCAYNPRHVPVVMDEEIPHDYILDCS